MIDETVQTMKGNVPTIGQHGQQRPPQQTLNVDPADLDTVACDACGSIALTEAVILKRVSALQSPGGKPGVIPMQTFACASCGSINDEFNPDRRGDIHE